MAEREMLIELLRNQNCHSPMLCDKNCKYAHLERCYEDRTADGLLSNGVIVPPCKVGDTVYAKKYYLNEIHPYQITNITITQNKKGEWTKKYRAMLVKDGKTIDCQINFAFHDIGKTVFLAKEEAEKALKERIKER